MKAKSAIIAALLVAFGLTGFVEAPMLRYVYTIEEGSRLIIQGSSNVNSFDCIGRSDFPATAFTLTSNAAGDTLRFSNAVLYLRTKHLDCDNAKMNQDLCDALKAGEFPYIKVELHGAMLLSGSLAETGGWANLKALATLTITDSKKRVVMGVKAQRLANGRFRFVSSKDLRMTDFGVQPPQVMLGLIKVNNAIRIHFDLTAQTRPEQTRAD